MNVRQFAFFFIQTKKVYVTKKKGVEKNRISQISSLLPIPHFVAKA